MAEAGEELEALKEQGWRVVPAIDSALERGDIDEADVERRRVKTTTLSHPCGKGREAMRLSVAGRTERSHPDTVKIVRRAFWIDAPAR
jgi:hypothetical protein